jgi:hypothetical protein
MSLRPREKYFVFQLDEDSYRPSPEAEYAIQFEDRDICAYVGRDSNRVIALIQATASGPKSLPVDEHSIPEAVIEIARQQRIGFGEYVSETGQIVAPSFLPPSDDRE